MQNGNKHLMTASDKQLKRKKNKELYQSILTLAMPIVIQNLIGNSLVMVDTVMISRLGEAAIAAVGIAGRLQFIFMLLCLGIFAGAGVFIAQYNGSSQREKIREVMALQCTLAIVMALIFSTIALVFGENYMRIFSKDPEVIQLGMGYLRYLGLGFVFMSVNYVYVISLRSIKDPLYPMFVSIVSLTTNTILNYCLIFGNFGFPKLGVQGAAIATSISRVIEFSMMLYSVYFGSRGLLKSSPRDVTKISKVFLKKYIHLAWPIMMGEALWGLGTVMYSLAYSRLGTSAFAATQIAQIVNDLMLVGAFGMASSAGSILGNKLGEGNRAEAIEISRKIMRLTAMVGLLTGVILMSILPVVPRIFNISGESATNVQRILMVRALANCVITFNWTNVTGILRSGGDTKVALMIDVMPMWIVGIPLAFFGVSMGWPVYFVVMASFVEEMIKFVVGLPRAFQNKWANVLVRQGS